MDGLPVNDGRISGIYYNCEISLFPKENYE
jgi:hypothetical protein